MEKLMRKAVMPIAFVMLIMEIIVGPIDVVRWAI